MGCDVLDRFNASDLGSWKGSKYRLHQRMLPGLGLGCILGRVARLENGGGCGRIHESYGPAISGPALQCAAETLRQITGGIWRGGEFDPARAVIGKADRALDLKKEFHVAIGANELQHMLEGGIARQRLFRVLGQKGRGAAL